MTTENEINNNEKIIAKEKVLMPELTFILGAIAFENKKFLEGPKKF